MCVYVCEIEEDDERVKEEDRLIATIAEIDEQTSLVPRGAFVLEPTGHVTINRCFEGNSTKMHQIAPFPGVIIP